MRTRDERLFRPRHLQKSLSQDLLYNVSRLTSSVMPDGDWALGTRDWGLKDDQGRDLVSFLMWHKKFAKIEMGVTNV
mgnify:FL=1